MTDSFHLPPRPHPFKCGYVGFALVGWSKPLGTINALPPRIKSRFRQIRRFDAGTRGQTRMVRFTHCSKLRLQTRRLCRGKTKGRLHL